MDDDIPSYMFTADELSAGIPSLLNGRAEYDAEDYGVDIQYENIPVFRSFEAAIDWVKSESGRAIKRLPSGEGFIDVNLLQKIQLYCERSGFDVPREVLHWELACYKFYEGNLFRPWDIGDESVFAAIRTLNVFYTIKEISTNSLETYPPYLSGPEAEAYMLALIRSFRHFCHCIAHSMYYFLKGKGKRFEEILEIVEGKLLITTSTRLLNEFDPNFTPKFLSTMSWDWRAPFVHVGVDKHRWQPEGGLENSVDSAFLTNSVIGKICHNLDIYVDDYHFDLKFHSELLQYLTIKEMLASCPDLPAETISMGTGIIDGRARKFVSKVHRTKDAFPVFFKSTHSLAFEKY